MGFKNGYVCSSWFEWNTSRNDFRLYNYDLTAADLTTLYNYRGPINGEPSNSNNNYQLYLSILFKGV
jgi:hypothetical protein